MKISKVMAIILSIAVILCINFNAFAEEISWKNAYAEFLESGNYREFNENRFIKEERFAKVFIDEDNIPEIAIAFDDCHVACVYLFTYCGGEVIPIGHKASDDKIWYGLGSWGGFSYNKYENCFVSGYSGMGQDHGTVYSMVNCEAIEQCYFLHDYYKLPEKFFIDDIVVTEEEYNEKSNMYMKDDIYVGFSDMIAVTENNINKYILEPSNVNYDLSCNILLISISSVEILVMLLNIYCQM